MEKAIGFPGLQFSLPVERLLVDGTIYCKEDTPLHTGHFPFLAGQNLVIIER